MQGRRHGELRRATAAVHQELDELVERRNFFGSVEHYGCYLARMHLFHRQVEPAIAGSHAQDARDWLRDDRIGWLEADMGDLDRSPLRGAAGLGRIPLLPSPGARLGALYVIVGSSLGARMLVRRLEALGLPPGRAARYLGGLAAFDGWKAFLAHLEATPLETEGDLLAGALATFDCVSVCLSGAVSS